MKQYKKRVSFEIHKTDLIEIKKAAIMSKRSLSNFLIYSASLMADQILEENKKEIIKNGEGNI